MNEIPLDQDEILNLSEKEYYEYILKSTEVQKTLFDLFIAEIKTFKIVERVTLHFLYLLHSLHCLFSCFNNHVGGGFNSKQ